MSRATVEIVTELDALEVRAPEWWDLWRRTPAATPFLSPAWLLPWYRSFAPGPLLAICVWRGRRMTGLAPLYREQDPGGDRILPLGIGISDYLDLLIEPGEESAGELMWDALSEAAEPWRLCSLEELPPFASALQMRGSSELSSAIEPQSACPVLDLHLPSPAGVQRRLRRGARRAARAGGFAIRRIDDTTGADAFFDALSLLHGRRWSEAAGEDGVLAPDAVQHFHRATLPGLIEAGLARLFELRIGGRMAGCYYGFFDRGRAYAYIGGFDSEFAAVSPGNLLVAHAIEEARREGGCEFHFLRGRERYKYEWGAVERWNRKRCFAKQANNGPA